MRFLLDRNESSVELKSSSKMSARERNRAKRMLKQKAKSAEKINESTPPLQTSNFSLPILADQSTLWPMEPFYRSLLNQLFE